MRIACTARKCAAKDPPQVDTLPPFNAKACGRGKWCSRGQAASDDDDDDDGFILSLEENTIA